MSTITNFIKRYPQATFWALAWSTWFLGVFMSELYPSDLWNLIIYSPLLIGVFVTAIADGRGGLKTYFSRIVRWRVGLKWYAVALLIPPVLYLAAAGLNVLSGATIATNIQMPPLSEFIMGIVIFSFLLIALGEEPGFRGFALPRLLVGRTAFAAGLILGVLHAIWHIPTFLGGGVIPIVSTVLIIISGAVINTWLFNHTNGSVLLADAAARFNRRCQWRCRHPQTFVLRGRCREAGNFAGGGLCRHGDRITYLGGERIRPPAGSRYPDGNSPTGGCGEIKRELM